MQEQWTRWEPISGLPSELDDLISCCDDYQRGFKFIVKGFKSQQEYHFCWKNSVMAYKKTQERLMLTMFKYLHENYEPSFYCNWAFFKIANSNYLKELSVQSGGLIDYNLGYIHFVIFTEDTVVEVIANYEPEIITVALS